MDKQKIAIIGSGISGISAAFLLSKKFEVHLFEKNNILGGHTRTINFKDSDKNSISIDTGFIVFNNETYPDLVSLFNLLDVKVQDSDMSFAVSCMFPFLEYGGSSFNSLFAQRKNIFSIKFLSLLLEIQKFYKVCKKLKQSNINEDISIDYFLNKNNFSKQIANYHIYPLISSIWSSNVEDVKNFPFKSFLNFFNNHGLFNLTKRPQWKFVSGGSFKYIDAIINQNLFNFSINFTIKKIMREKGKIYLIDSETHKHTFDKLIFATHADQIINLLDSPTQEEINVFSNFKYTKNKAYLHSDENCMPKNKRVWSSWNFLQDFNKNQFSLTYWMNNLQNINGINNYFVSINPSIEPKNIIDSTVFEHPIFNSEILNAQKKLGKIQGMQNTFYCGSYCGYGFHEDGIQSSAYIAEKLGVNLPWKRNNNFVSRLSY
tara:strand:+ start:1380 stop:2672 length:1293 start_codon:yes stop_codon:yes gene_type:complete